MLGGEYYIGEQVEKVREASFLARPGMVEYRQR